MPKLFLFFAEDFQDDAWADRSYCLEAPEDSHHHGGNGEWVIGRDPASDLTIALRNVSRKHCLIAYSYRADRWTVEDMGSTAGTMLSGQVLAPGDPVPIAPGDRLWLGPNPIYVAEDEGDTIGDDDGGPPTVVDVVPLDYRPQVEAPPAPPAPPPPPPPPAPRSQWDVAETGLRWLIAPTTNLGAAVRLAVVGMVATVVVVVFDRP